MGDLSRKVAELESFKEYFESHLGKGLSVVDGEGNVTPYDGFFETVTLERGMVEEPEHEADMESPPWADECPLAGSYRNKCYGCERTACALAKRDYEQRSLLNKLMIMRSGGDAFCKETCPLYADFKKSGVFGCKRSGCADAYRVYVELCEEKRICATCAHNSECGYNVADYPSETAAFEDNCVGCCCGEGYVCNRGNETCDNWEFKGLPHSMLMG